ncbi:hypothetical protein BX600DRAFT_267535 [Xylariales sp. PMI_506]|nr:hypothetical protein BX600DRAFT_267535 [Xylariales sp. PMI_506]
MSERRKRRRTGCLSCRARHVKCDEKKPTCERCEAANITCAGYEQVRRVQVRRSRHHHSASQSHLVDPQHRVLPMAPTSTSHKALADSWETQKAWVELPVHNSRPDGLPLVALPTNPREQCRPHDAARPILAYHQYLFRTVSLLFPEAHLYFWRDRLSEAAWELEYVFEAIIALGTVHRAVLLLSTPRDIDKHRGIDTQVIAAQAYVKAIQSLSASFQDAERSLDTLAAVLVLLAYFECFSGNHVAARGHLLVAGRYLENMLLHCEQERQSYLIPIGAGVRTLQHTLQTSLPYPCLMKVDSLPYIIRNESPAFTPSSHQAITVAIPKLDVQQLLDLVFIDNEIADTLWNPWGLHEMVEPQERLTSFQESLRDWKRINSQFLPTIQVESTEAEIPGYDWAEFIIPPPHVPSTSPKACFAFALYCFAMARVSWYKLLLREDTQEQKEDERSAFLYFYLTMRAVATMCDTQGLAGNHKDTFLACETVHIGLLPILHITGQCTPAPSWRQWIAQQMRQVGREGVFDSSSLAASLDILHTFEMQNLSHSAAEQWRYPPSITRVVSILIPEVNGRSYTAYYANIHCDRRQNGEPRILYSPLGHSRWSLARGKEEAVDPRTVIYTGMQTTLVSVASDWLRIQTPIREWSDWATSTGFDINRVLRDHVRGSQLLKDLEEVSR